MPENQDNHNDEKVTPRGELALQTVAMPKDTNANGDIFGGWLVSQMDMAAGVATSQIAKGRVATVAIDSMIFLVPVKVGSVVTCYAEIKHIGRSSIRVLVEVWATHRAVENRCKVTEGIFTFVAIDEYGRTRTVPKEN